MASQDIVMPPPGSPQRRVYKAIGALSRDSTEKGTGCEAASTISSSKNLEVTALLFSPLNWHST